MSLYPIDEYLWHPTDASKQAVVRRCFGIESFSSYMETLCDGFTHLTVSAAVAFPSPSSDLKTQVEAAWIHLRHLLPQIASKGFQYPEPDNGFALKYEIPSSCAEAQKWASDTIFFADGLKSLYERHVELKDNRVWLPGDNHYVAEVHVSPLESGWNFSLVISHNSIDGRNALALMDLLLESLADVVEGKKAPIEGLEWGVETARLVPPAPLIKMFHEKGKISDLAPPPATNAAAAGPPPSLIPWMFPPQETGNEGDVTRLSKLSKDATAKLHEITKQHGRTVTQVITALSALAHIEAYLKIAGDLGEERFKTVSGAYAVATHYLVAFNFVNHRQKLPGGYDSYKSPTGAPLCAIDGIPIMAPADNLKQLVKVDEAQKAGARHIDEELFWKVVEDIAGGWKQQDLSLEAWYQREVEKELGARAFNPAVFRIPALIMSSIGDTERLGLFAPYLPSSGNKTLVVEDIICGIRLRTAPPMNLLYQYDGQLQCHWMTAGEFSTARDIKLVTDIFEERLDELLHGKGTVNTIAVGI